MGDKRSRHTKLYEKGLGGKVTVTLIESTSFVNVLESQFDHISAYIKIMLHIKINVDAFS